jgi:CheY-like chemotaxis protein
MSRVVAVVQDLFFVARIRETARGAEVPITFARSPAELEAALSGPVGLVLMDLTTPGWDYGALFAAIDRARRRPRILAYTTHVLAGATKPWHARCDRVVTKETLTSELGQILRSAGKAHAPDGGASPEAGGPAAATRSSVTSQPRSEP